MKRSEARLVHLAVSLAAASGFAYGWMLYIAEPVDEFALVNHPWQPTMHHLHVLLVPLFVFVFGLLWRHHIVSKLRSGSKARRRTGIVLLASAIPMIATGYAVQVAVDPDWRTVWVWLHGISSTLFTLGFVAHLLVRVTPVRA